MLSLLNMKNTIIQLYNFTFHKNHLFSTFQAGKIFYLAGNMK